MNANRNKLNMVDLVRSPLINMNAEYRNKLNIDVKKKINSFLRQQHPLALV